MAVKIRARGMRSLNHLACGGAVWKQQADREDAGD